VCWCSVFRRSLASVAGIADRVRGLKSRSADSYSLSSRNPFPLIRSFMAEIDIFFEQELGCKVWDGHLSARNLSIMEIKGGLESLDYPTIRGIAGFFCSLVNGVQNHGKRRA
jgi:hypothetical protein